MYSRLEYSGNSNTFIVTNPQGETVEEPAEQAIDKYNIQLTVDHLLKV